MKGLSEGLLVKVGEPVLLDGYGYDAEELRIASIDISYEGASIASRERVFFSECPVNGIGIAGVATIDGIPDLMRMSTERIEDFPALHASGQDQQRFIQGLRELSRRFRLEVQKSIEPLGGDHVFEWLVTKAYIERRGEDFKKRFPELGKVNVWVAPGAYFSLRQ